jgi:TM2 domain-containing membrane protein YozV
MDQQPAPAPAPAAAPADGKHINKHIFVWVFCFLLGGFGVDRFMRGQVGLGIVKLLFGWLTLGIWELVDWIIALSKAYGGAFGKEEDLVFTPDGKYAK